MYRFVGKISLLVVVMFALVLPDPSRAQDNLTLGLGFDYERGDYGGDSDISTYTIPLSVFWYPDERFDLILTIPYVYQSGGIGSAISGNRRAPVPAKVKDIKKLPDVTNGETDTQTHVQEKSRSGLGDITLEVGYSLLFESVRRPLTRLILYGKIPTADDDRGLGTGAFDFGIGTGLGKRIEEWSVYVEAMYIKPGDSQKYRTEDYFSFSATVARLFGEFISAGTSISLATDGFNGNDIWEIAGNLTWRISPRIDFQGYLIKGLSEGAADTGGGLSTLFSF